MQSWIALCVRSPVAHVVVRLVLVVRLVALVVALVLSAALLPVAVVARTSPQSISKPRTLTRIIYGFVFLFGCFCRLAIPAVNSSALAKSLEVSVALAVGAEQGLRLFACIGRTL